jgi:hypothetical protein
MNAPDHRSGRRRAAQDNEEDLGSRLVRDDDQSALGRVVPRGEPVLIAVASAPLDPDAHGWGEALELRHLSQQGQHRPPGRARAP